MKLAGNIIVEFCSLAISSSTCKLRSWSAIGCAVIMSAASPSFLAERNSPSAEIILARLSLSASAYFAIDLRIVSGKLISLISTAVTCTPHGSLCLSIISLIFSFIFEVEDNTSSKRNCPITFLMVV